MRNTLHVIEFISTCRLCFRLTGRSDRANLSQLPEKAGRRVPGKFLGEQETSMKIPQICAMVLLLVFGSMMAFADGINDPKIVIHGVNGGNIPDTCGRHGCQGVGLNFSFVTPKGGSGTLFFTNESGKNWTSLTLIENGVPATDISCKQTLFLSCTTKTEKNGSVEILLSGVRAKGSLNPETGILNGQSFSIGFACVGQSCWPGGLSFTAHAGAVPEPETVALMMTGLGAIISRRKAWLSRLKG
jgi:hypothetical protein